MLVLLSRLPVFDKDFSNALSHDLELLAISKTLKFFTNLPVGQNLQLIQKMYQRFDIKIEGYTAALTNLVQNSGKLSAIRFKDYVKGEGKDVLAKAAEYEKNN